MRTTTERRREPRLPHERALFVNVQFSGDDESLTGKTFHCASEDISSGGLRIRVGHPVPKGCALELWVGAPDREGTLVLKGQVKWSKETEKPGIFLIGIELVKSDPEQRKAWVEIVSNKVQFL